jgi:NAD(P)H-hydrate epimerase
MRRLVTSDEMRAIDQEAIENRGIPGYDLMTAAGSGVAEAILEEFSDLEDAQVAILAGCGNNGGDGFVVARLLKKSQTRPVVILLGGKPTDLRGDAARAYKAWKEAGGKTLAAADLAGWEKAWESLDGPELVVDAMLGTGSRGDPRGVIGKVVETLESVLAPVVSVDIPTGLDAGTGEVPGACVHADLTVTMALPKRGHLLYPGRSFVGELQWVDIGIPDDVLELGGGFRVYVPEPEDIVEHLPDRDPEMHKGDRGRLLVVGGSAGLTGSVALASGAAVRAGAGLVTAGIPLGLNDVMEMKLTEAMTLPLPQLDARALSREAFDPIALFQPGHLTALAVGPGMGRHSSTQDLARRIIADIDLPTVLDADGLFAFAGKADLLRVSAARNRLIITPHPGEFVALTGESMEDIHDKRLELASRWARRLGVVLVLKGAPTVIADPDHDIVYLNPTGSEALATGGTGDVLTGLIGGFLAQGVDPVEAAVVGTYLHGWTADTLVEEWGSRYGLSASDLVDSFPYALGLFLSPPEGPE